MAVRKIIKRYSYICFHVFTIVLTLALFELFKTTQFGIKYKNHTIKTVKALMESELKENNKLFIANNKYFNDYTMKDFLVLLQSVKKVLQDSMIKASGS